MRLAQASSRFRQLYNVWFASELTLKLKLQLYMSGVCSILTHAMEAWKLTEEVARRLRGWNGRNLALIVTGKCEAETIRAQTRHPVRDMVAMLRVRRLRWVGHILRMDDSRRLKKILLRYRTIYPHGYPEGSILMDAPKHDSIGDLVQMAGTHGPGGHKEWDERVLALKAALIGGAGGDS